MLVCITWPLFLIRFLMHIKNKNKSKLKYIYILGTLQTNNIMSLVPDFQYINEWIHNMNNGKI